MNQHPRQPNKFHDPIDPLKVQKDAFTLYPLIYSGGLDRQTDIYRGDKNSSLNPITFHYNVSLDNPYESMKSSPPQNLAGPIGAPGDVDNDGDEGWADNIHNHLIGLR